MRVVGFNRIFIEVNHLRFFAECLSNSIGGYNESRSHEHAR